MDVIEEFLEKTEGFLKKAVAILKKKEIMCIMNHK